MSWITQNKFVVGFGAVMLLGTGALGYLTYAAKDRCTTANESYEGAISELKRLQSGHPYPEEENRKELVGHKAAYQEKIAAFQKQLADTAQPVEPMSPTEFQDKLKETVARVSAKAAGDGRLTLPSGKPPDKFYMGFPEYADRSPKETQVTQLRRELMAFESIINLMLASKDVELKELSRAETKEDKEAEKRGTGAAPAVNAKAERKLVHHTSFTLKFESSDIAFRSILNGIVGSKDHFFIVRRISVSSSKPQAPEKKNELAPPKSPQTPSNTPVLTPEPQQRLEYIFGTERVNAHLEIELVDFAKPEMPAVKADKKPKEAK